ncbi:MAG: hypothetical protein LBC90_02420 [Candidatus Adiutrix sp.]|nr:hypothetical protein [Candidatus Adiutrix sp.]
MTMMLKLAVLLGFRLDCVQKLEYRSRFVVDVRAHNVPFEGDMEIFSTLQKEANFVPEG